EPPGGAARLPPHPFSPCRDTDKSPLCCTSREDFPRTVSLQKEVVASAEKPPDIRHASWPQSTPAQQGQEPTRTTVPSGRTRRSGVDRGQLRGPRATHPQGQVVPVHQGHGVPGLPHCRVGEPVGGHEQSHVPAVGADQRTQKCPHLVGWYRPTPPFALHHHGPTVSCPGTNIHPAVGGPTDHLHPTVTTRTHEKGHVLLELTPAHPVHPGHVRGLDQEAIPQPTQANTNPPHQRDDPGQGRNTEEHPQHRMIDHPAQPRAQTQHHQYQQWPPVPMPPDPSPHATPSAHDPPRHRSVRIIRKATHGRAVHTMPGTRTTRRTPHPDRSPVDDGSARRRSLPQWSKAPHMPAHAVERPRCPRPPNTRPDGGEPPCGPLSPPTAPGGPVADRKALDRDTLAVSDRFQLFNFTRRDDHVTYLWILRAVDHLREVHQVQVGADDVAGALRELATTHPEVPVPDNGLRNRLDQLSSDGSVHRFDDASRAGSLAGYRNRQSVYQFSELGYWAYRAVENVLGARVEEVNLSRLVF